MGEKTLCFVDRKCEACGGEGCEDCQGTGLVGSVEEREPIPVHPDGVSKALEARRIAQRMSLRALGEALGVSTARASQLCRGVGEKRDVAEYSAICRFILPSISSDGVVGALAEIGGGSVRIAEDFILELSEEIEEVRKADPWPENVSDRYQALGRVHAAYQDLARAVELDSFSDERRASLKLIIATLRLFFVEYSTQCAG